MLTLSQDGYIRLSSAVLRAIPLIHLLSGLDEEVARYTACGADACTISGYAEWTSTTSPVIAIGWDWKIFTRHSEFCYARISLPRSNVMLVDSLKRDLGYMQTSKILGKRVDELNWQQTISSYISARYAGATVKPNSYASS